MQSCLLLSLAAAAFLPTHAAPSLARDRGGASSQVFLGASTALQSSIESLEDRLESLQQSLRQSSSRSGDGAPEKAPDASSSAVTAGAWGYWDGQAWLDQASFSGSSDLVAWDEDEEGERDEDEDQDEDQDEDAEGDLFWVTRNSRGRSWRHGDNGGARDDNDPRDGTDPGDGPPYHRNPHREPPHHTPQPPSGFPFPARPRMPPRDRADHGDATLLDILAKSKDFRRLYALIKDDSAITDVLGDRKANVTIFAPNDRAVEKLMRQCGGGGGGGGGGRADASGIAGLCGEMVDAERRGRGDGEKHRDMVRRVVMYHMADGTHHADDLRMHNTLVSRMEEEELGKGVRQRLRLGLSSRGPTVNYYSEIARVDSLATNGVLHTVDAVLLPPPPLTALLSALPTEFSTTTTALQQTGLLDELSKLRGRGSTVFAPSNRDWQKLGFRVNAFLFSPPGRPYLRALLKYHVVPDASLYSDALVEGGRERERERESDERDDDPSALAHGFQHVGLRTLLGNGRKGRGERHVSVDINRLERFLSFRLNGLNSVIISDGITRSGVVQVPDHILLPPHSLEEHERPPKARARGKGYYETGVLDVDEIVSLLEPFVEQERGEMRGMRGTGAAMDGAGGEL